MPPPVVQCDICKQMVNKCQTHSVGNGKRACKEHEGVVDKKDELVAKEKESKEKARQREEARRKAMFEHKEEARDFFQNKCWACRRPALTRQQLAMRMLIANEKLDIKKVKTNLLDPNYAKLLKKEITGGKEDKSLLVTDIYPVKGNEKSIAKLPIMIQNLCLCVQVVSLCQDCRNNLQINPIPDSDLKIPSFDDLMKVSAVYEVILRPEVRAEAMKEVIAETQQN